MIVFLSAAVLKHLVHDAIGTSSTTSTVPLPAHFVVSLRSRFLFVWL